MDVESSLFASNGIPSTRGYAIALLVKIFFDKQT